LTESASLDVSKWVNALSGTGVETVEFVVLLPPDDDAVVPVDAGREVPLTEVVALAEIPVLVLALARIVPVVEDGESAELEFTFSAVEVVLTPAEDSADVEEAGPELEDVVSSAFPELAAAPDPAPDDEPALLEATAVGAVLTELD
jgi:hypothetical protein